MQAANTQRTGTFMVAKAWDVHCMQKKLTAFWILYLVLQIGTTLSLLKRVRQFFITGDTSPWSPCLMFAKAWDVHVHPGTGTFHAKEVDGTLNLVSCTTNWNHLYYKLEPLSPSWNAFANFSSPVTSPSPHDLHVWCLQKPGSVHVYTRIPVHFMQKKLTAL